MSSQSHLTDQGSSEQGELGAVLDITTESQSHLTDQGSSEVEALPELSEDVMQKSQSHLTDQGSSELVVPPIGAAPAVSQSHLTDQGSSEGKGRWAWETAEAVAIPPD